MDTIGCIEVMYEVHILGQSTTPEYEATINATGITLNAGI